MSGVGATGKLTIEGADTWQVLLPAKMLAVDLAKVGNEEGVFFAGFAHLMVDGLNTLVKGLADELLGVVGHSILQGRVQDGFLQCKVRVIDIVDIGVEDCRCHNHVPNGVRDEWEKLGG